MHGILNVNPKRIFQPKFKLLIREFNSMNPSITFKRQPKTNFSTKTSLNLREFNYRNPSITFKCQPQAKIEKRQKKKILKRRTTHRIASFPRTYRKLDDKPQPPRRSALHVSLKSINQFQNPPTRMLLQCISVKALWWLFVMACLHQEAVVCVVFKQEMIVKM